MNLSKILSDLDGGTPAEPASAEKTASAETGDRLEAALTDALAATKEAAAPVASVEGSPTEDMSKIASRLAGAEQEALVKEAELYGAAICDGFMSRMDQYDVPAGAGGGTKTAAYGDPTPENFEKFASENPDLVKQAMDLGYRETRAQLEKVASDSYSAGYEKTAATIKMAAEDCARRGMEDTNRVLASLQR